MPTGDHEPLAAPLMTEGVAMEPLPTTDTIRSARGPEEGFGIGEASDGSRHTQESDHAGTPLDADDTCSGGSGNSGNSGGEGGGRPVRVEDLQPYWTEHFAALVRHARKFVPLERAEECVSDVLLHQLERVRSDEPFEVEDERHLRNLIYDAVKKKCFEDTKKRKRREELANDDDKRDVLAPVAKDVELSVSANETFRDVEGLPPPQPRVLELLLEGYSTDEIARELGTSPSTAKRYVARVRQFLMSMLAALFAWLKKWKRPAMVAAGVVAILLFSLNRDSACRSAFVDPFTVEYEGECAIGLVGPFADMNLVGAETSMSRVEVVLHGKGLVSLVPSTDATEPMLLIKAEAGSYVVLVNGSTEVVRNCQGASCRDVAPGEHVRSGTYPQQWQGLATSVEDRLLASTKRLPRYPIGMYWVPAKVIPPADETLDGSRRARRLSEAQLRTHTAQSRKYWVFPVSANSRHRVER